MAEDSVGLITTDEDVPGTQEPLVDDVRDGVWVLLAVIDGV